MNGDSAMTHTNGSPAPERTLSLMRLPVFDDNLRLWGYELYCVESSGAPFKASSGENTVTQLANSAYMALQHVLARGKKIILDFDEKGILQDTPYAFPPSSAVVSVHESIYTSRNIDRSLDRLKSDGFLLSVGGFSNHPGCEDLYIDADILCVSVQGRQKNDLSALLESAHRYHALVMATQVENPAAHGVYKKMGFSLFSGSFFKTPDVITLHEMTSGEVARLNILKLLESEQPNAEKLVELVQSDVSVSFRLLAYLNSTAFKFSHKIKSVQEAVSLLGWHKVKNWLYGVLNTDVNPPGEIEELMLMSTRRGKFLERVAADHDYWGFEPESLYLLGLFSLLDVML
jgi:EAL and modified HD-GYP domain-containing signal transduction protein